jgi:hypothetical protein
MPNAARIGLALVAGFLALCPPVTAQRSDSEWLASCRDRDRNDQEVHCEVRHLALRRGPLDIDPGENGGVTVRAWDRDSIAVTARVQANGETVGEADALAGRITVTTDGGTLRVDGPSTHRHAGWGVEIVLMVPRHTDLTARTVNGPIGVTGVTGRLDLSTVNGPIDLHDVAGDVHARAQNGPLDVSLAGQRWEGAGLDAETVNGPVTLAIPHAYSAKLETGTVNGPWDLRMPLTVTLMGRSPRHITSVLGDGGAPVRVVTTNGPVTVETRE